MAGRAFEAEGGVVPHPAALALPTALTPNAQTEADSLARPLLQSAP
jgi:hypothetical protein